MMSAVRDRGFDLYAAQKHRNTEAQKYSESIIGFLFCCIETPSAPSSSNRSLCSQGQAPDYRYLRIEFTTIHRTFLALNT